MCLPVAMVYIGSMTDKVTAKVIKINLKKFHLGG